MRFLPLHFAAAYAICFCTAAFAQAVLERGLLERVTRPDTSLEYDLRNSSFRGGKPIKGKDAQAKDYLGSTTFRAKDFQARSFLGGKDAWVAEKSFRTKESNLAGRYQIPNRDRQVAVGGAAVKEARDAGKTAATGEYIEANKASRGGEPGNQGRSQQRLTREQNGQLPVGTTPVGWSGNMRAMTIDDIRELLNKNK